MFSYLDHRAACTWKQQQRASAIEQLPAEYSTPATEHEQSILAQSLSQLVSECNAGDVLPADVLLAYGKRALLAQEATNCLADIMFEEAEHTAGKGKLLAGVPISVKDCIDVQGHDTTSGFSSQVGQPRSTSAPIIRLLQDAGALVHAKTTLPTALLSFETISDVYGETTNPYNANFSPGASTGGGGALLAYQGSLIDIGTDIGGSTRFPATCCGVYSLKNSSARFPSQGCLAVTPGSQSVPTATAPMARTLEDLEEFWIRVMQMRPWDYDHSCVPMPWRPVDFVLADRKPKWGVMWDDGIIAPTPACRRALSETVDALKRAGCEVTTFTPPDPVRGLRIGYSLAFSDGGDCIRSRRRTSEFVNGALDKVLSIAVLPRFVQRLVLWAMRVWSRPYHRNDKWIALASGLYGKTITEERALVLERDEYRADFHRAWREQGIDLLLTVPHSLPPVPRGKSGTMTLISANYAFMYNILDYAAGVVPVGFVDRVLDARKPEFMQSDEYLNMNDAARGVHGLYDADAMHGLPLGVQVVGGYLQEERTLEGMKFVQQALRKTGREFVQRKF